MRDWKTYVPTEWPPSSELLAVEPSKEDYPSRLEYGAAVRLRSSVLWWWRKNYLRAEREKEKQPNCDLSKLETRAQFEKRAKKGKDRLGLRKKTRKRKYYKSAKRSGCSVICPAGFRRVDWGDDQGDSDDGEEDVVGVVDLTQCDSSDEEVTATWLDLTQCDSSDEEVTAIRQTMVDKIWITID
uniref:Uncharacterized protein n=1 Tax=Hyaloperonospora arabidopsidis (strain Emoy2) TaxID=559515 RepID=M4BDD7_HYAAE